LFSDFIIAFLLSGTISYIDMKMCKTDIQEENAGFFD